MIYSHVSIYFKEFCGQCVKIRAKEIHKGGIMSEDNVGLFPLPKNILKNYLELSYPVHSNDKELVKFNRLHGKKNYNYEIKI